MRDHTSKIFVYLSCLAISLFFFYVLFLMGMLNTISQQLIQTIGLPQHLYSLLSASYFLADAIFLIPVGIILDRYNTRKILLFALAVCVISHFYFAFSNSVFSIWIYRITSGIGNAFAFLGTVRYASYLFPNDKGFAISSMITIGIFGGIVAQSPLALLIHHIGWENAMSTSAFTGLLIFIFALFFLKDNESTRIKENLNLYLTSFKGALSRLQNWLCAFYAGFLNLMVSLFSTAWSNLYLIRHHNYTNVQASSITSMIFIGVLFGAPAFGYISDIFRNRKNVMIFGALGSFLTILPIVLNFHVSFLGLYILFMLLGVFSSAQVISYPTVAESNPSYLISAATGVIAITINIVAAFSNFLFDWISQLSQTENITINYQYAIIILPVASLVSLFAAFILKEPNKKKIGS